MARTTTNYGWNISEGSDLVNPLTDIFPNFESLDTDLKNVSDASIGEATELKTGTVHALTRTDTSRDVFKFTATANFTAGDTFTVDSEQVSALTTSGEQLTTGCYVIGSEVIVAKKGTLLTFFISNVITDASTLEGHSASYFATASDLADTDADVLALSNKVGSAVLITQAQDCSGAINELASRTDSYTYLDSSTGSVDIKLPASFKKLHILARVGGSLGESYVFEILKEDLSATSNSVFRLGYCISPSAPNYEAVFIQFTKNESVKLIIASVNSVDQLSTSTLDVYYK